MVTLKNSDNKNRIIYLDLLRVLAMIAVILIHTSATQFGKFSHTSTAWIVHAIYDSFVRWGVPVFVMISGAVFLNPQKVIWIRTLLTKYIPRIVIIYLFWSVLYMLKRTIFDGSEARLPGILLGVLKGHFHMWYLPMLVGLYLTVPVLRRITSDKKVTEYYLLLSLIFAYLIPSIIQLTDLVVRDYVLLGQ